MIYIEKGNRMNFGIGMLLVSLVSLPTLMTIVGHQRNGVFLPENRWPWHLCPWEYGHC